WNFRVEMLKVRDEWKCRDEKCGEKMLKV
uniref:Uncharacterized protein n=1 Tax=Meloidogyne javanica TaxID=6303 RepID=A0A915LYH6_MELJA